MVLKVFRDLFNMSFQIFNTNLPIIDRNANSNRDPKVTKKDRWGTVTPPELC